jgi:uroporphyrin-III C-methyltransferase
MVNTQNKKSYPKLTLAGAGPGDTELITVKALRALSEARVILYDALVNPALLDYASPEAKKIFVGKRKGQKVFTQQQINELIVEMAFTYGHVLRLKGGDPFVFGRGYEEIEYAASFQIETEVIPGISSSIGVPARAGIPVTHRGCSESFWVITGTTQNEQLSKDLFLASQSSATVVILMGLHKLHEIVEVYRKNKKDHLPVAIIQNGTLPEEKVVVGTLSVIEKKAEEKQIASPAIIIIGEVVKKHPEWLSEDIFSGFFPKTFLNNDSHLTLVSDH